MLVRCEDDGRGLDYQQIRQTAVKRGLLEGSASLIEEELGRLVLLSGFAGAGYLPGRFWYVDGHPQVVAADSNCPFVRWLCYIVTAVDHSPKARATRNGP